MVTRMTGIVMLACAIAGCKAIDGSYQPGCAAFEGDTVTLRGGEFSWDRFTDQVSVDEDGNVIEPFPGYPRHGTYRVDGRELIMSFAASDDSKTMHLHRHEGRVMLLTEAESAQWEQSGRYDDCVLTLASGQ